MMFLLEEADDPRKAGTMTLGCEFRMGPNSKGPVVDIETVVSA